MVIRQSPQFLTDPPAGRASRGLLVGLALAGAGHLALGAWIVSQTFHPLNLSQVGPEAPPMTVQTVTLEPAKPAPATPQHAATQNQVHASSAPIPQNPK